MREHGFVLYKFVEIARRSFRPVRRDDNPFAPISQMLWCDAVFVRDFTKLDSLSAPDLLRSATMLHTVYHSYDLVHLFLEHYDCHTSGRLAPQYLAQLGRTPNLPTTYLTQRLQP